MHPYYCDRGSMIEDEIQEKYCDAIDKIRLSIDVDLVYCTQNAKSYLVNRKRLNAGQILICDGSTANECAITTKASVCQ